MDASTAGESGEASTMKDPPASKNIEQETQKVEEGTGSSETSQKVQVPADEASAKNDSSEEEDSDSTANPGRYDRVLEFLLAYA